jgi:hypothetical protein
LLKGETPPSMNRPGGIAGSTFLGAMGIFLGAK